MTSDTRVLLETEGQIASITLIHPPANALDNEALRQLVLILLEVSTSPAVRAVIITGDGDRMFCAGGDLKEWARLSHKDADARLAFLHDVLVTLDGFDKPIVCAVNGDAVGAGCEIVLFSDIAIASSHARFGFPEIAHGVVPIAKGIRRLVEVVGPKQASSLLLRGTLMDATEAKRRGMIDEVVQPRALHARAHEQAHRLAVSPAVLVSAAKRSIRRSRSLNDDELARFTIEQHRAYSEPADGSS